MLLVVLVIATLLHVMLLVMLVIATLSFPPYLDWIMRFLLSAAAVQNKATTSLTAGSKTAH